ncbi:hypothetical protein [Paracoccus sp. (in: a-proteobacteria)]|uniref:hypothetical protein n=1 Tax=Paracoccus sp. TaxID=267 RepID=UPI0026E10CF2|nr:hypothetical protein [Paracoccus sp. (in: a-proteobacteria)]MDO5648534.1 hypothetical protein [Paracoccus sp. (in: a-proteobacteria)]
MRPIHPAAALMLTAALLAGCSNIAMTTARPDAPAATPDTAPAPVATQMTQEQVQKAVAVTRAPAPRPAARATAAQMNTTTREQRAAAAAPAKTTESRLGTTVASLGNPTEGGFWVKTPLVKERSMGRVVNPANGKSAQVELIPLSGGTGSQVSLPALQLLGVSLTDLPTLELFRS